MILRARRTCAVRWLLLSLDRIRAQLEIFINLADNASLDEERFVPFAKVIQGMDVVDRFYSGYGEMRPEW